MSMRSEYRPLLRLCVVDVLRHGGGATFEGVLRRLNDSGCIGWRELTEGGFTREEVYDEIMRSLGTGFLGSIGNFVFGSGC